MNALIKCTDGEVISSSSTIAKNRLNDDENSLLKLQHTYWIN